MKKILSVILAIILIGGSIVIYLCIKEMQKQDMLLLQLQQQAHEYELEMYDIHMSINDYRQGSQYVPPFFNMGISVSVFTPDDVWTLNQLHEKYQIDISAVIDLDYVTTESDQYPALMEALRASQLDVLVYCVPSHDQQYKSAMAIKETLTDQCKALLRDSYITTRITSYADLIDAGYQIVLSDYASTTYQYLASCPIEWEFAYVSESYTIHDRIDILIQNKRPVTLWILGSNRIDMSFVQNEIDEVMSMKDDIVFGSVEEIAANVQIFDNERTADAEMIAQYIEAQEKRLDELQKMIDALYE